VLRPDPAQAGRLTEIIDNLAARLAEAHQQGWLGEVDGIEASLSAARHKLAAMERVAGLGHTSAIELTGKPPLRQTGTAR
jgi:hypothetical protein